jgi:hypothetical protein
MADTTTYRVTEDIYDSLFLNVDLADLFVTTFPDSELDAGKGVIVLEGVVGKFKITVEQITD